MPPTVAAAIQVTRWLQPQDCYSAGLAISLRTLIVVAMGNGTDPSQAITRVFDDLLRGFTLRKEPHDLPMASCNRVFRFAILVLDLFEAEVRFNRQTFLHDISIHQEMV